MCSPYVFRSAKLDDMMNIRSSNYVMSLLTNNITDEGKSDDAPIGTILQELPTTSKKCAFHDTKRTAAHNSYVVRAMHVPSFIRLVSLK